MAELLLDPAIRFWVFLPIVLITFLIGVVRHYASILLTSKKKVDLSQVQDRWVGCDGFGWFCFIGFWCLVGGDSLGFGMSGRF